MLLLSFVPTPFFPIFFAPSLVQVLNHLMPDNYISILIDNVDQYDMTFAKSKHSFQEDLTT